MWRRRDSRLVCGDDAAEFVEEILEKDRLGELRLFQGGGYDVSADGLGGRMWRRQVDVPC